VGHYSTPEAVKTRTGIQAADLGLEEDGGGETPLDNFLGLLLEEISDLMSRTMRKDWIALADAGEVEEVPAGLNGIAADIAADSVRAMVVGRQTPVVRIDDFAVRTVTSATLSRDVLKRLKLYSANGGVGSYTLAATDLAELATDLTAADLDTMDI
jgi:hypothetical protein